MKIDARLVKQSVGMIVGWRHFCMECDGQGPD